MNEERKRRVLVVDDEISVLRFTKHSLEIHGFQVVEATTGASGLQKALEDKPEIIILDFGLPDMTGLEVLKRLRGWTKTPVIFLTARDSDEDKIAALDGGADDYLTKPFSVPELLVRIRVAFRHAEPRDETPVFRAGALEVDRGALVVRVGERTLKLTSTEYQLLSVLVTHAGKVVPHRIILREVWGPNSVEHIHYLRVYFGQIRKKMEALLPGTGGMIETESGVGYRLKI